MWKYVFVVRSAPIAVQFDGLRGGDRLVFVGNSPRSKGVYRCPLTATEEAENGPGAFGSAR